MNITVEQPTFEGGLELSSAEFILRLEGLRNWNSGIMEYWNNG
jgi:hypothetical protein